MAISGARCYLGLIMTRESVSVLLPRLVSQWHWIFLAALEMLASLYVSGWHAVGTHLVLHDFPPT